LLLEKQRRSEARKSLQAFTEYTTPNWQAGKIHRIVCAQFDRVVKGEIDRLMLLCPPQHGKSTIGSRRVPAFSLGLDPRTDVISASATAQLAEEFGRDVRNCISSSEYRNLFPETKLAEDSQAKGRWNTSQGGGYYAVGIGGALMGRGGELGLIDDPFATWEDGQSQLSRDKAWEWYRGTFYNRIRPGGRIIVIQHRMHEDDLVGRLLAQQSAGGDRWEVVELPALLDDPPWPERYDRKALERIKANTDQLKWSALYLQNPQPEEGTFFKREWFWFYDPTKIPNVRKYLTSDFAFTEGAGDFTELGIHGVAVEKDQTRLYLGLDGWYGQADQMDWVDQYLALVQRHRPLVEFGEGGMPRRASEGLITRLRRERKIPGGRVEWLPSMADKVSRATPLRAMASMGRVGLPDNDYGHRLLGQFLGFPAGKYDDAVDMCGMMARVIDQAHPAMALQVSTKPKQDKWDKAFDGDDEVESWRVA
jgi:hypothetical protein